MSLLVWQFCCTGISSRVFGGGREKLLEICLYTMSVTLKVHLPRFIKCAFFEQRAFWSFLFRFLKPSSLICSPKQVFTAHLDHVQATASYNPPQQTNPSDACYNKRKNRRFACVEVETVATLNAGCRKAIGSCLNTRNNRRAMNKSEGGRHLSPNSFSRFVKVQSYSV